MDNSSSNNGQQIDKCQDCPHKYENTTLKEENKMLKMSPYFDGEDISSVEDNLQNKENQYDHY